MPNEAVRVLLTEEATREVVTGACERRHWYFDRFIEQRQTLPAEWLWRADEENLVSYIEDGLLRWRYLLINGPVRDRLAADLRPELPHLSKADVLDMWDAAWLQSRDDPDPLVGAAHALGIVATTAPDPDIMARLAYGLRDGSAEVRLAALRAVGFAQWTEFYETFRWIASNDPDAYIRHYAEGLAIAIENSGTLVR